MAVGLGLHSACDAAAAYGVRKCHGWLLSHLTATHRLHVRAQSGRAAKLIISPQE